MIEFQFVETHGCASPGEERSINYLKIKNKKGLLMPRLCQLESNDLMELSGLILD